MIELLSYEKMNTHTFDCWTFENVISNEVLKQVIWDGDIFHWGLIEGMRTDKNYRIWMNKYASSSFQHICKTFDDATTKRMFGDIVGCDYSQCRTRIELCKDEKGSWLHNHFDDKAKLFTLQLYLSDSDVSTSFNNSTTGAKNGSGWFFKNTGSELHGLPKLNKRRISIIVNYVDDTWRDSSVLV